MTSSANYGYGENATGGAGGTSYVVTTLADSGVGSLREAIDASGARIITFGIAGLITCETRLRITNPNCTIDGSTAPYPGITLRHGDFNDEWPLSVETSNVVVEHIRIRGAVPDVSLHPVNVHRLLQIRSQGQHAQNVTVKNCSCSWGIDGCVGVKQPGGFLSTDITIQDTICGPPLMTSVHDEGSHGMALEAFTDTISGATPDPPTGTYKLTFFRNLILHAWRRMPELDCNGPADCSNNVIYDWDNVAFRLNEDHGRLLLICENNYFKGGPRSNVASDYEIHALDQSGYGYEIYLAGNTSELHSPPPQTNLIRTGNEALNHIVTEKPFTVPYTLPLLSASDARDYVVANVGATLPRRDIYDQQLVDEFTNGNGLFVDDPNETLGWEWWGYLAVENLALTAGQRDNIFAYVDTLYVAEEPVPALLIHSVQNGQKKLFERVFGHYWIDDNAFKTQLATELSVTVGEISTASASQSFGTGTSTVVTYTYNAIDQMKVIYLGQLHSDRESSRVEALAYVEQW